MQMKKNEGVTLVALILTVVIMVMVSGTVIYNSSDKIKIGNLEKMYVDIKNLKDKTLIYYSKYQTVPTIGSNLTKDSLGIPETQINPNDGESSYSFLYLEKLSNISLKYGKGYEEYKQNQNVENLKDIYIINTKSQTIYYLDGIEYEGEKYYALPIDYTIINNS